MKLKNIWENLQGGGGGGSFEGGFFQGITVIKFLAFYITEWGEISDFPGPIFENGVAYKKECISARA